MAAVCDPGSPESLVSLSVQKKRVGIGAGVQTESWEGRCLRSRRPGEQLGDRVDPNVGKTAARK